MGQRVADGSVFCVDCGVLRGECENGSNCAVEYRGFFAGQHELAGYGLISGDRRRAFFFSFLDSFTYLFSDARPFLFTMLMVPIFLCRSVKHRLHINTGEKVKGRVEICEANTTRP